MHVFQLADRRLRRLRLGQSWPGTTIETSVSDAGSMTETLT